MESNHHEDLAFPLLNLRKDVHVILIFAMAVVGHSRNAVLNTNVTCLMEPYYNASSPQSQLKSENILVTKQA